MGITRSTIEKKILEYLKRNKGHFYKQRVLARKLNLHRNNYPDFKRVIRSLSDRGTIERYKRNSYRLPDPSKFIEGTISLSGRGFGFVTTDRGEEIFIGIHDIAPALNNDRVLIEKYSRQTGKNPEGKVVRVLQRTEEPIFGTLKKNHGEWVAYLGSNTSNHFIKIINVPKKIKEGQLVEIKNLIWKVAKEVPTGEIKQIIGIPDDPHDDLIIIKRIFNLPVHFPRKVLEEAENFGFSDMEDVISGRLDLRDKVIFTIDPFSARDFDDAISLEKNQKGDWILGVHISDVSNYVEQGSHIDQEAKKRGTSIYFYEDVINMLPSSVSQSLCSLNEKEDRLTLSVIMILNSECDMTDFKIMPSVIRSKKRFTYEEVQSILNNGDDNYCDILKNMRDISRALYLKRCVLGSIDFDIPEMSFRMSDDGVPYEVKPAERLESHRLVEEFMLLANKTVAEWIGIQRKKERLPFLYRVHEPPTKESVDNLYFTLKRLGQNFRKPSNFTPSDLSNILNIVSKLPFKNFIEMISLRAMSKAYYSKDNPGHFGLAFRYYTHFTSPIRRYPDLMVHRLVKLYLNSIDEKDLEFYRHSLPKVAKRCSEREVLAMEAEREYVKIKQIRFLAKHVGEWFSGIITGVTEYGFYVEISEFLIEGLVHVKTLYDDFYIYDEVSHTLSGRKSKRIFRLGDQANVQIIDVSVSERKIDLEWGE